MRRGRLVTVRLCFPAGAGCRWPKNGCAGYYSSRESPPCLTDSGPLSGTGRPSETNHPRDVIEAALAHVVQQQG